MPYNVDEEIELLSGHIKRLGKEEGDGYQVTFKVVCKMICRHWKKTTRSLIQELFVDDQVANTLESLAGTLKAAKKKAVVSYGPELLLQVLSTTFYDNVCVLRVVCLEISSRSRAGPCRIQFQFSYFYIHCRE